MFVGDRQIKTIPVLGRVKTEDGCPILPEALAQLCPSFIPGAASAPVCSVFTALLCGVKKVASDNWKDQHTPPRYVKDKKILVL